MTGPSPGAGGRPDRTARSSGFRGSAQPPTPDPHSPPVQQWGVVVTRLSVIREIPTAIGPEQLIEAVRLFQPYRDGPARVELEQHEITWRDRKGLHFALRSVGEATEIRVFVSKILIRRGRWRSWVRAAADRLEAIVWLVAEAGGGDVDADRRARLDGPTGSRRPSTPSASGSSPR